MSQSNALGSVQKIARFFNVINTIVLVCSLVGVVLCSVGLCMLPAGNGPLFSLGPIQLNNIFDIEMDESAPRYIGFAVTALILCVGELIQALFVKRYLRHELNAGNPFTHEGAQKLRGVGIALIVVPIVTIVVAQVTNIMLSVYIDGLPATRIESYGLSVGVGISIIFLSVIFRYGAEVTGDGRRG